MTMTQQAPLDVLVEKMTARDARDAIASVVETSGFTLRQLRQQAEEREFHSLRARLAWLAIDALEEA